jgi:PAS domain S-box-containing protein
MSSRSKTPILPDPIHSALKFDSESLATLKLLAHLVEETSDILTAADIDFKPITWNKASEKIYGLKAEQVIGKELREFVQLHYPNSNREEVREIINTQGEWRGEVFFVRPSDKKIITLLMSYKQLKEENGNLLGYLISATDITERKEAESRLKESEQRFRDMADSSPAMIWLSDENNVTVYTNKKWIEFTGKDISNDPNGWSAIIHPDDEERVTDEYFKGVRLKKQVTTVYRLRREDGVYRWVHDTSVPRILNDGKFIGYIGSVIDIEDERQKHEQLVYQSTILDNVSDIVVTTDINYRIKIWNKIAEEYYGVLEKDAVGKRMSEVVTFTFHGTTTEEALKELNEKGIWAGEVSRVNKQGETKYFFHTVKYVYNDAGNKIGYLAIGHDITEKKIAEEKLKESELFYRTLIADSMDGMVLLNRQGIITFASPSVKTVLDYDVPELVGKDGFQFVHPDDIKWAFESFEKEIELNTEIKYITIRLVKKNGQWIWCTLRGHNLLNNPYINSIVIYFHDDTLRKEAREALQESEKRFRSLIRELQVGVFLSDAQGNIIMCNKALSEMFSVPEESFIGKKVYEMMPTDIINEKNEFIPVSDRPLSLTLQFKQTIKDTVLGVLHPVTKERSWILVNADPILDEEGNIKHIVCSVMNLTERKKLEEKLISEQINHQKQLTQATIDGQENERREIGKELHDNIGQQLTTIKLFLDYAKTTADESTSEMVNVALKAVSDVINDVRAMSRSLVPFTLKDLGLIESMNELIDSLTRAKIVNIEFRHIKFDESSVPENQKLTLFRIVQEQLNNIVKHADAKNVYIRLFVEANELVLEISDDGKGFDEQKVRKGLGILNIKNRVELFNGKTQISSIPGKGCIMTVSFPLADPASDE